MIKFDTRYCIYNEKQDHWKPKPMIQNLKTLLDYYKINVRFNELTKELEFFMKIKTTIHNRGEVCLIDIHNKCVNHNLNINLNILHAMLINIADSNSYHPVRDYIYQVAKKYPQNDTQELQKFMNCIVVDPQYDINLKETILKTWLVSCVKAVVEDKIKSEGVLVLQGRQGMYKTTFLKRLAVNENWVKDGHLLDPQNKDTVLESINYWIVELGELEDSLKKELGRLKAFISKEYDEIRRPYAKVSSKYPRQTIYCASVNDKEFLKDQTGNRRWWVLPCISIDIDTKIDYEKLWSEIYHLYITGFKHYLDNETQEILNNSNQNFEVSCIIETTIFRIFDFDSEDKTWVRFSDILNSLPVNLNITKTKLGKVLNKMQIKEKVVQNQRLRYMPRKRKAWQSACN